MGLGLSSAADYFFGWKIMFYKTLSVTVKHRNVALNDVRVTYVYDKSSEKADTVETNQFGMAASKLDLYSYYKIDEKIDIYLTKTNYQDTIHHILKDRLINNRALLKMKPN